MVFAGDLCDVLDDDAKDNPASSRLTYSLRTRSNSAVDTRLPVNSSACARQTSNCLFLAIVVAIFNLASFSRLFFAMGFFFSIEETVNPNVRIGSNNLARLALSLRFLSAADSIKNCARAASPGSLMFSPPVIGGGTDCVDANDFLKSLGFMLNTMSKFVNMPVAALNERPINFLLDLVGS